MPDAKDERSAAAVPGRAGAAGEDRRPTDHAGSEPSGTGQAFATLLRALTADLSRLARSFAAGAAATTAKARRELSRLASRKPKPAPSAVPQQHPGRSVWTQSAIGRAAAPPPQEPVKRRRRGGRVLYGLALLGVAGFLLVGGTAVWALHDVPLADVVDGTTEPVVVLQAADGQAMVQQGPYQGARASREDFPDHLVEAVLAIEDRRFYDHWGLDFRGVARALLRNLSAGEVVEGGSTITQQLLKILHLEPDRTLKRKIQEAFLALWLESRISKDEILTRYLNNIYLGAGATGMPAAALVYFGKSVGELTLAESALLAGLIRAPSQLNPLVNLEGATERAGVVLNAMGEAGYLDPTEILEARLGSMRLSPSRPDMGGGSWFADWVIAEAREIAGPFRGSIDVKTTLVPALQEAAEAVVAEALAEHGEEMGVTQAALVALRPDGAVVAMVGGSDYDESEFNRAVAAERQPGSTFKLFVLYAALRAGYDLGDTVEDAPIEIDGWTPENYGESYSGEVSLAEAFARSLNAATVRLAMDVGIDEVAAAARDLGIDADLVETPSLSLGASEVTLLDLTGAYASVRAGVTPIEPWGIASFAVDGAGQAFRIGPSQPPERDLGRYHEPLVALLRLVVEEGTGQAAALDGFAAGKTGTSQESRDAWFVGFNEALTVGVWVGNDDGEPMNGVTGGELPATVWKNFMERAAGIVQQPAEPPTAPPDEESVLEAAVPPAIPDAASSTEDEPAPEAAFPPEEQPALEAAPPPPEEEPTPEIAPPPDDPVLEAAPPQDEPAPSQARRPASIMELFAGEGPAEVQAPRCNVRACSRAYRSFRASDCTFQPYRGGRKLCER